MVDHMITNMITECGAQLNYCPCAGFSMDDHPCGAPPVLRKFHCLQRVQDLPGIGLQPGGFRSPGRWDTAGVMVAVWLAGRVDWLGYDRLPSQIPADCSLD